jgi:alpha-ketoglutarate-dependent 2,4-dichlorophenoxyacetate dioxygenase
MSNFYTQVDDLDLSRPLSEDEIRWLQDRLIKYPVLVFPDQPLTDDAHLRLARYFGEVSNYTALKGDQPANYDPTFVRISNVDEHGDIYPASSRRLRYSDANELWHSDLSIYEIPASASILLARECVPDEEGGETEFADMRAAYEALSDTEKNKLDGMIAYHSMLYSRRRYGFTDFNEDELASAVDVAHPLVRRHPDTHYKSLYLSAHIGRFDGMSEEQSEELLARMMDLATQPDNIYCHHWSPGDVVIWDNQRTMHRGRPYEKTAHRRVMQRVTALVKTVIPAA